MGDTRWELIIWRRWPLYSISSFHWFQRGFLFNWSLAKCLLQTVAAQEIGKKTEACSCGKKNKLNPFGGFVFPSLLQGDYTTTLFCCGVGCFPWLAHLLHKLCHRNKSIRAWQKLKCRIKTKRFKLRLHCHNVSIWGSHRFSSVMVYIQCTMDSATFTVAISGRNGIGSKCYFHLGNVLSLGLCFN